MATTAISIETYLQDSSFKPDVEYIDGALKGRAVVTTAHGKLQSLISHWFLEHEDQWGLDVAVEARTQVSPTRVRLPDVVIDKAGIWPETLVDPPLIVVEILSPHDSYTETQKLAQDYIAMGIPNIWLIDPETRTARVCEKTTWTEKTRLEVAGTAIYLDVPALFNRLDRKPAPPQP